MKVTFEVFCQSPTPRQGFEQISRTITSNKSVAYIFRNKASSDFIDSYLLEFSENGVRELDFDSSEMLHPYGAFFSSGNALVIDAKCNWRSGEDFDRNGFIFDPKGSKMTQFLAGSCFNDFGIDKLDRIWVSFSDQGVYGYGGWNGPGPAGPGHHGLVCYNSSGELIWGFMDSNVKDQIDECYALNINGEEIWAYYYSSFNLCRIDSNLNVSNLGYPGVAGCRSFSVLEDGFLFSKQYRDDSNIFWFVDKENMSNPLKIRATSPSDLDWSRAYCAGVGDEMFLQTQHTIYKARLI